MLVRVLGIAQALRALAVRVSSVRTSSAERILIIERGFERAREQRARAMIKTLALICI